MYIYIYIYIYIERIAPPYLSTLQNFIFRNKHLFKMAKVQLVLNLVGAIPRIPSHAF